jgi:hypothetical protein
MIKGWSAVLAVLLFANIAHAGPKEEVFAADRASSQLSSTKTATAF